MNIRVTICHSIHYEKPQKMAFFRPSALSLTQMALIWGQNSNKSLQSYSHYQLSPFRGTTDESLADFIENIWRYV